MYFMYDMAVTVHRLNVVSLQLFVDTRLNVWLNCLRNLNFGSYKETPREYQLAEKDLDRNNGHVL